MVNHGEKSPSPPHPLTVAAVQFEPVRGDVEGNFRTALTLLDSHTEGAVDLVVLPEMGLTGYLWDGPEAIRPLATLCSLPDTQQTWVAESAQRQIWMVIGHPALDTDTGELRNRCTLVSPDGVVGHYDKTCLFPADTTWATPGHQIPPLWQTPWGTIAPLICADLDYPEPMNSVASRGASLIVFPTAWVDEPAPSATWRLRVAEYGIPLVAADITGVDGGVVFSGGSCVLDHAGEVVHALDNEEGVVCATVTLQHTRTPIATTAPRVELTSTTSLTRHAPAHSLDVAVAGPLTSGPGGVLAPPPDSARVLVLPPLDVSQGDAREQALELASGKRFVVGSALDDASGEASVFYATPEEHLTEVDSSHRAGSGWWHSRGDATKAALIEFEGVTVGILGAWALNQHHTLRAISLAGAPIALASGPHNLPGSIPFPGTKAPFPDGLGLPDDHFAHPGRFRAGDSCLWLALGSASQQVVGGVFAPNHIRWPRHEALAHANQWALHRVELSEDDPWGFDAQAKPLLNNRRHDLYPDPWTLTTHPDDRSHE